LIKLRVKTAGSLAIVSGVDCADVETIEQSTLQDVVRQLGVAPELIMLYAVNGTLQAAGYRPQNGDEVVLIPAVSGG
jgi:molybdopterin converting factor small subunit